MTITRSKGRSAPVANPTRVLPEQRSKALMEVLDKYGRLHSYFPTPGLHAQALGVSRPTIAHWDSRRPTRTRVAIRERLEFVLRLAEMADQYMPSPRLTGRWLLAPQPFLYGQSAVEFLRRSPEALEVLANRIAPAEPPVTEKAREDLRDAWPALQALSGAGD